MTNPSLSHEADQIILRYVAGTKADDLNDETPLANAGLDSIMLVRLMFDLEDELSIEFPDELVTADTFDSVGSLRRAVQSLLGS